MLVAHAPDLPTACPSCGAAVRAAVDWCGLCYASLAPEPPPAAVDPATTVGPQPGPRRGRHSRDADDGEVGAGSGVDTKAPPTSTDALADRLLAELAATRDPQPAWLDRLPSSTGGRVALIGGAVAVGTLLLVAAMSLLGLFL